MSFQDIAKYKSVQQNSVNDERKQSPAQDPMVQRVADKLKQYHAYIEDLKSTNKKFGTVEDSLRLREAADCKCNQITTYSDEIRTELEKLNIGIERMDKKDAALRRGQTLKLKNDLDKMTETANQVVRECVNKLKQPYRALGSNSHEDTADDPNFNQFMVQMRIDEEQVNTQIIEETEQELLKINQDVRKINEIQKELASLVQSQQGTIDTIQNNVNDSHAKAEQGLEQLHKAAKHQTVCIIS